MRTKKFLGRALGDSFAVREQNHTVRNVARRDHVVADDDRSHAVENSHSFDEAVDDTCSDGIDAGGRLVVDEDIGFCDHCPSNPDTLGHAPESCAGSFEAACSTSSSRSVR